MPLLQTNRRDFLTGTASAFTLSFLPGAGRAQAMIEMTAAQAVETLYYLPLYVAHAKGFFAEEGLDVTIFNAQQRTVAVRAVASGDAFTYNGDPAEPAIAREQGVDIKNIGVLVDRAAPVLIGQPGTSADPADWAGNNILIPRPPHTSVSLLQMTLIDAGYEKQDGDGLVWALEGDEVRLIPVIAGSELSALLAGQADLAVVQEPQTSNGVAQGMDVVTSFAEQFGPFYFTSFAVMTQAIADNPEQVQAFVNGITRAMVYGHEDPDGAAEVAVNRYSDSDPEIMAAAAKRIIAQGAYPSNMVVSRESYANNFDRLLTATGHPAAGYAFEELMDLSFAEKAAATFTR
jgi:NitT/TauT family transport system substrate-binding protein